MYQLLISFPIIFLSLLLAIYVISRNPKSIINSFFLFLALSSNTWLFFSTLSDQSKTVENALLFARLAMLGAPIFFAFVCAFSIIFPKNINYSKKKLALIFLPVVPIYFFIFSDYNVKSVKIESWGTDFTPGILYYYVLPLVVIYLLVSLIIWVKKFRVTKGIAKNQIKYIILSLCLSSSIGFITNCILPVFFNFDRLSVLGPPLTIFTINALIAYAIIKYRLLDIRLIVQKSLGYTISVGLLVIIYCSLMMALGKIFNTGDGEISVISAGISMVVGVLAAQPLLRLYQRITDPIFFKDKYHYSEVINKLNETINREIELDKMLDKTLKIISDALKIKKIVFLLFDEKLKKFVAKKDVGFPVPLQFELSSASALAQYLAKIKEAVIAEELEIKIEDGVIPDYHHSLAKRVVKKLKEWDVYLCQPVIRQTKLIAIVCVGEKLSLGTFSDEDLRLVNAFANQIVIAMQNFMVYKEILDKNVELEKNLKLMTGRELKMMELKNRIKELEGRGDHESIKA